MVKQLHREYEKLLPHTLPGAFLYGVNGGSA